LKLFLQAAPGYEIREEDNRKLHAIEHVSEVHHLHFWSLDGEHHVLTAHLVLDEALFRAWP
jgi:cobalt-zinc-cadmium efflux system protein